MADAQRSGQFEAGEIADLGHEEGGPLPFGDAGQGARQGSGEAHLHRQMLG